MRAISSLIDFTQRKQFEEKLRSALEEISRLKNQEVFAALVEGRSMKQVAFILNVSHGTVNLNS